MIAAALTGFATGFSLILAIGAQNAFVLRQGLLRQHVFPLCLLCALSDALLIAAGVAGFGVLVTLYPAFPALMAVAGAIFLFVYGLTRFVAAVRGSHDMTLQGGGQSLARTLAIGAAFTWANPHVYLDTLGLVGAVSTAFPPGLPKWAFGIGAVTASFVFFFGLGYGARLLAPIMTSARAWARLDLIIGVVMWAIALKLVWPFLS